MLAMAIQKPLNALHFRHFLEVAATPAVHGAIGKQTASGGLNVSWPPFVS
jgi:hypothetical protein